MFSMTIAQKSYFEYKDIEPLIGEYRSALDQALRGAPSDSSTLGNTQKLLTSNVFFVSFPEEHLYSFRGPRVTSIGTEDHQKITGHLTWIGARIQFHGSPLLDQSETRLDNFDVSEIANRVVGIGVVDGVYEPLNLFAEQGALGEAARGAACAIILMYPKLIDHFADQYDGRTGRESSALATDNPQDRLHDAAKGLQKAAAREFLSIYKKTNTENKILSNIFNDERKEFTLSGNILNLRRNIITLYNINSSREILGLTDDPSYYSTVRIGQAIALLNDKPGSDSLTTDLLEQVRETLRGQTQDQAAELSQQEQAILIQAKSQKSL